MVHSYPGDTVKAYEKGIFMVYGFLISVTIAMVVVFYIDTRQKIRQHSRKK